MYMPLQYRNDIILKKNWEEGRNMGGKARS